LEQPVQQNQTVNMEVHQSYIEKKNSKNIFGIMPEKQNIEQSPEEMNEKNSQEQAIEQSDAQIEKSEIPHVRNKRYGSTSSPQPA